MTVSPSRFRRAYNRFQEIHVDGCGERLDSFRNRDSFAYGWEGYKYWLPDRALEHLEIRGWAKGRIGDGTIFSQVVDGIQIKGNNLLQWEAREGPGSEAHHRLIEAGADPDALADLESLFYELFKRGNASREIFDGLIEHCGRRYEVLAYLFFIADPTRFLPIRTRSFDRALSELGVDLKTEGQCSWDNYLQFLDAIAAVRGCLRAEGISDASLLDAHSFCWILARHRPSGRQRSKPGPAKIVPFSGTLLVSAPGKSAPKDDARVRDMRAEAERRQASGQIAEEVALEAERRRLSEAGRDDLAAKVDPTPSKRPGLGFDIKCFDEDGRERFIEVKNVSKGNRFFLSENEWLNSQKRENYWFYLVAGIDTARRSVQLLPAKDLKRAHLEPVQYLVRFER